jgi:hypothetical protein
VSINIYDPDLIFISTTTVLNKKTGEITELSQQEIYQSLLEDNVNAETIEISNDNFEVVKGVDSKKIELGLSDGSSIESINGFLIEVYFSGTDGKLTKLNRKDSIDPITRATLKDGFEQYFSLEVDQ